MMTRQTVLATLLALLSPLTGAADPTDTRPADATPISQVSTDRSTQQTDPAATAPPPAAANPAKGPVVTWDVGAWLVTNGWASVGAVSSSDLPRFALPDKNERATGISIRQSRLRTSIGVPDEVGFLGGALLKGFVEIDFAGGYAGTDESQPLVRLRHAYVTSTWKHLGNLTLLLGQTTDIFHGSVAAASLAHLATPRFSGAGYLHRRAPQARLSGELGGDVALAWQVGALSPSDKATQTTSATSVGSRSFAPDLEGRVALLVRGSSPLKVELGAGGRYAQEKWLLAGAAGSPNGWLKSQGVAADVKIEAGPVALVGGAFAGENLDLESSLAPGVITTPTSGNLTSAKSIPTRGGWGQLQVAPVKALLLLAGGGLETPRKQLLPNTITLGSSSIPAIDRNLQLSAGLIVNPTGRWRAGVEYTRYQTHGVDHHTSRSDQIELSSLLAI